VSKRKTATDKAIENIDQKITEAREAIKALELARAHLVTFQDGLRPKVSGHTEGGQGV